MKRLVFMVLIMNAALMARIPDERLRIPIPLNRQHVAAAVMVAVAVAQELQRQRALQRPALSLLIARNAYKLLKIWGWPSVVGLLLYVGLKSRETRGNYGECGTGVD